jgi:hypothetical protein
MWKGCEGLSSQLGPMTEFRKHGYEPWDLFLPPPLNQSNRKFLDRLRNYHVLKMTQYYEVSSVVICS